MNTIINFSLVAIAFGAPVMLPQAQKPIVEAPLVGDFYGVPNTLEGLVEKSEAVAIVRIQRAVDAPVAGRARTTYTVAVETVIKPHKQLGPTAQVCRAIGSVEQPARILKQYEPRFPGFEVGKDYLLFLRWSSESNCLWPMYGAPTAAIFDAVGKLQRFSRHPALEVLEGLDKLQVATKLAAIRR